MRRNIMITMHHNKTLIHQRKDLVLASGWGCKISAPAEHGSLDMTSLAYSLFSLTWCSEFACFTNSTEELGIFIDNPEGYEIRKRKHSISLGKHNLEYVNEISYILHVKTTAVAQDVKNPEPFMPGNDRIFKSTRFSLLKLWFSYNWACDFWWQISWYQNCILWTIPKGNTPFLK